MGNTDTDKEITSLEMLRIGRQHLGPDGAGISEAYSVLLLIGRHENRISLIGGPLP
jgi:hypothetical protein